MAQQFSDKFDEIDILMSQIDTEKLENNKTDLEIMNGDLDNMDILMSQIDTEMYQEVNGDLDTEESDTEIDEENIPEELLDEYQLAMNELLPEKSGNRYEQAFGVFEKWQKSHGTTSLDEKVVLCYFFEAAKKYKPSTLWSMYSMLKKTFICKHNVDISKFSQLKAFLKKNGYGFKPKKAPVFTPEEVQKFLVQAPNDRYLAMKTILVFGVIGACRGDELTKLTTENVVDKGNELVVKIPYSKTNVSNLYQIDGQFAEIVREYMKKRVPNANTNRFFLQYRNGKCVRQVMGKNSIAKVPKEVAKFLELPDLEKYTGHSMRRTSTTILADTGANIETLKRHGNWKSSTVCEGYIAESLAHKRKTAKRITGAINLPLRNVDNAIVPENKVNSSKGSSSGGVLDGIGMLSQMIKSPPGGDSGGMSLTETLKKIGIASECQKKHVFIHFEGECSNFAFVMK